ncbi:MAG: nuclear transport factor 2 family protein [Azospirillaceae bacterium]
MTGEARVRAFLETMFATLDREAFATVASWLAPDAELGDELTGGWRRGREDVAAYLAGQSGAVTEVRSRLTSVAASCPADGLGLATFAVRQTYRLGGAPRDETLLGTMLVDLGDPGQPRLRLLHLGPARAAAAA